MIFVCSLTHKEFCTVFENRHQFIILIADFLVHCGIRWIRTVRAKTNNFWSWGFLVGLFHHQGCQTFYAGDWIYWNLFHSLWSVLFVQEWGSLSSRSLAHHNKFGTIFNPFKLNPINDLIRVKVKPIRWKNENHWQNKFFQWELFKLEP